MSAAHAQAIMRGTGLRLIKSNNFLASFYGSVLDNIPYDFPDLNAAQPQFQHTGETDEDFLLRVLPAYNWAFNLNATGMTGMVLGFEDASYVEYYWSPPPPTLAQIKALADYTVAGGDTVRNGFEDSMQIVSMIPFRF
jgi:hypothetical protein